IAYSLAALRLRPGAARRLAATPGYVAAFTRLLGHVRPTLVHANSHTTLVDLCLARMRGFPAIFHVHEIFGQGRKWDAGRRLAFWAARDVVAVSDACAAALAVGEHRARVVRNGVPIPPEPEPRREAGPVTVGTVGV